MPLARSFSLGKLLDFSKPIFPSEKWVWQGPAHRAAVRIQRGNGVKVSVHRGCWLIKTVRLFLHVRRGLPPVFGV